MDNVSAFYIQYVSGMVSGSSCEEVAFTYTR